MDNQSEPSPSFPSPTGVRQVLSSAWKTTWRTLQIYGAIDGEQRAASFAYYVLFSLFPLFALLLTVGSQFLKPAEIIDGMNSFLPLEPAQKQFVWDAVDQLDRARGGVGVVSVVILLWCSLRFFQALVRGVNRAWHTIEIPWWQMPLKNLLMVGIVGSALFAGLLAPALLQGARNALLAMEFFIHLHFPDFNLFLISMVIDLSRYFIGGVVLFYAFSMLYKLAPRRKVLFSQVWLAALLVTLALQICQVAFVNYLPLIVNYGIYGAVGLMMLLLMWVYVSGMIIILGGCLCAAIGREEESFSEEKEPTPTNSRH